MFEPMLVACPVFVPAWRAFLDQWKDSNEELPYYLALGDLAHHLVEQLEAGATQNFDAVFDVVERWHCHGDAYVREAATIGLLEGIENVSLRRSINPRRFEFWLKPESKRWW
ncbi:hypothetical protein HAP47_0020320 [Bradyrhizobium sp. 41S5]|uniref:DUF7674 family protein n=1 Tax=Bradyrhizobium sp. 41S5 TaxID=1404443 RepID=UPI001E36C7FB|nr:hypothetical protein [Bradyrhizobium sp. 41S5]UFX41665.1 hypothetical protein HAP47_0020320 [Bradyrhizobium sp. 41S5]